VRGLTGLRLPGVHWCGFAGLCGSGWWGPGPRARIALPSSGRRRKRGFRSLRALWPKADRRKKTLIPNPVLGYREGWENTRTLDALPLPLYNLSKFMLPLPFHILIPPEKPSFAHSTIGHVAIAHRAIRHIRLRTVRLDTLHLPTVQLDTVLLRTVLLRTVLLLTVLLRTLLLPTLLLRTLLLPTLLLPTVL